jgi:putative transposase
MKKVRFTETQIISILKQQEAGISIRDLSREHGVSEATSTTGRRSTAVWRPTK